jgi:hypothetical protein
MLGHNGGHAANSPGSDIGKLRSELPLPALIGRVSKCRLRPHWASSGTRVMNRELLLAAELRLVC